MPQHRILRLASLAFLLLAAAAASSAAARADMTAGERAELQETSALARRADAQYRAGDYAAAGQSLTDAMRHLERALADADAETYEIAARLIARIERDHARLQLEGVVMPPFERPVHGVKRPSYLGPADAAAAPDEPLDQPESPPVASLPPAALPLPGSVSPSPAMDAVPATVPATPERISFARQIAPLLVDNCNGCHLDATQTRGGLRMDTFAELMRGGASGPAIDSGRGASSLLVRKLRGEEGNRMPAGGRDPLSDEEIALVSTWIDQGASLDGASPEQPLRVLSAQAWAKHATTDELAERRRQLARKNWQLGAPAEARTAATETENEAVFVIGNVSAETADRVAKAAVTAWKKVRTIVPPPARDKGNVAAADAVGPVTLFVFPRRYDYSEFSKMVERREIPADWQAHWQYDGVDAYASLVVEEDDPKAIEARLIAPLTSLAIASRGDLPRWFSEGIGRAAAARLAARELDSPRRWDAALPAAVGLVQSPDQITEGKLAPEQTDLIGYGVGKTLLDRGGRRQFQSLLHHLDGGMPFEQAFTAAVGAPPEQFLTAWFRWYATQRRR